MTPRSRAIVLRTRAPPSPALLAAELRLAQLVREVDDLDDEVATVARELSELEARYREATAAAFAELDAADRLVRKVRRLASEVEALEAALAGGPRLRRREVRRAPPPSARSAGETPRDTAEAGALQEGFLRPVGLEFKALYRRLARRLHPDLAGGDEKERARRSDLMARVNAAYARGDLAALELLAERVGAVEVGSEESDAESRSQLARRIGKVEAARARLEAQKLKLASSQAARLREEATRRATAGGDLFGEICATTREHAEALRAEALFRLGELSEAARVLSRSRERTLAEEAAPPRRRGDRPRRRPRFDPVALCPLVRAGRRRSSPSGGGRSRALARWLEDQASRDAPWPAALTLLAFLNEEVNRPLPSLASFPVLAERWDALRGAWPGAPGLGRALAEAPRHVEVGLRLMKDELWAGLELEGASEGAGVRAALADEAVANLTRRIMAALGPREKCERCGGDVYAVHLVRLSGLDEIHGLACPGCARVLRSFWRFGERERRLEKIALGVGLVAEERLRLSGATLVFQMLPTERIRLTARALLRRFRELCLEPNGLELPRDALAVRAGRALLPAGARVPEGPKLEVVTLPKAGETEAGLLARVRARVRARFSAA